MENLIVKKTTRKAFTYTNEQGNINLSFQVSENLDDQEALHFLVMLKLATKDVEDWIASRDISKYKEFTKGVINNLKNGEQ